LREGRKWQRKCLQIFNEKYIKFDQEMCKDCQQELARRQTLIGEDVNVDEGALRMKQIIN
jgi:hypothetical protein